MKASMISIIGISDVSVGYGSPQIPALIRSLADHYQTQALIIEPDQVEKTPLAEVSPNCSIRRIGLTTHPHSFEGRLEYITKATQVVNDLRPSILVIFCTYSLPVLLHLKYKPQCTVYNSIESIMAYGQFDIDLNRHLAEKIDVILFPEENRARWDGLRSELLDIPMGIVYNAVNPPETDGIIPSLKRRPVILYSGTLNREQTLAGYFLGNEVQSFPIDLYGPICGEDAERLGNDLQGLTGKIRYQGMVPAASLNRIRKQYAYSLIMWAPKNENQLFACPNKLFEAIADGVPPITAPHPQAKMLVNRYRCGIIMDDWSYPSFIAALHEAMDLFGTDRYDEMVQGCQAAVQRELNWDAQFAKIKPLLPKSINN